MRHLACPSDYGWITAGLFQAETCICTSARVWEGLAGLPGGAAYLGENLITIQSPLGAAGCEPLRVPFTWVARMTQ